MFAIFYKLYFRNYEVKLSIIIDIDNNFPLENGWALKNNQKYGQRGSGKRITLTVRAYLEGFFLAGNLNKTDRMSAKDMITELKKLAEEGEIQKNEVPEIKTVKGWITRYSASLRKESAELRVLGKTNKRPEKNHNSKYGCKQQKK